MHVSRRAHDVVAKLNQRQGRWFNVATKSYAHWEKSPAWSMTCHRIVLIIIKCSASLSPYPTGVWTHRVQHWRQYLLSLQASRYWLLSLQSRAYYLTCLSDTPRTFVIAVWTLRQEHPKPSLSRTATSVWGPWPPGCEICIRAKYFGM